MSQGAASGGHRSPTGPYVRINDSGSAAPADRSDGFPLRHLEDAQVSAGDDGTLWAWTTKGPGTIHVYESV